MKRTKDMTAIEAMDAIFGEGTAAGWFPRDPRIDPRAGDIVQRGSIQYDVIANDGENVLVLELDRKISVLLVTWREWVKSGVVVFASEG